MSPLVDAGFAAELETLVLTAAHDVATLVGSIEVDATVDGAPFTQMNGKSRALPGNDMLMRDAQGTICTIIYGQDDRTPVTPATRQVLYVSYCPAGISAPTIQQHHNVLKRNVAHVAPKATIERPSS